MRWAADRRPLLGSLLGAGLALASACHPAQTENPYAELPAPDADPDARIEALERRADAATERAAAIAEEAKRQSKLPSCGCEGTQACRVRCEPPNEPQCACTVPSCSCVPAPDADP
jgi:hypothetical protein